MTPFTFLIPHYRVGKATAYAIYKLLKHSSERDIKIIVIDNSNGEGMEYLHPFANHITILTYPQGVVQSHGCAYDFAMKYIDSEYFITMESDSFPTEDNWLNYYDQVIEQGFEMVGSLLQLSGGNFIHAAGAMYSKKNWLEAKAYVDTIDYCYFPNLALREDVIDPRNFEYHLMVRNHLLVNFLRSPNLYVKQKNPEREHQAIFDSAEWYKPVATGVFHNGMGGNQEAINTFQGRDIYTDAPATILNDDSADFIYRIGYEPGQWFFYWHVATGKRTGQVPTEIKWLPNRENEQQEYTKMENGFIHLWGGSAYDNCEAPELQDIVTFKKQQVNDLYNSMPEEWKI